MSKSAWDKLDITNDELNNLSKAFKSSEFRKLFAEYCNEISDPENRRQYEKELTELEAERGITVTFINPEPGYVIKTSVNGDQKAFINVAKCDKISKPSSASGQDEAGQRGLHWNIPYTQSPARRDVDHSGAMCPVYDVVFHPQTLHLADKNIHFRKLVTRTACEAVERTHGVSVDMANLRFPKIGYKGTPRPTIIRERNGRQVDAEASPIDLIYPPLKEECPKEKDTKVKPNTETRKNANEKQSSKYTTPKFQIVHRRDVELHEMTDELDAKINLTIPKELVVKVHLPLLKSTKDVALDVTSKTVHLISEMPAKYKLQVDLPFEVDESNGSAKFDSASRKLEITLPVVRRKKMGIVDLSREDSGVESDHHSPKEDSSSDSSDDISQPNDGDDDVFADEGSNIAGKKQKIDHDINSNQVKSIKSSAKKAENEVQIPVSTFLDPSVSYILPAFNYNRVNKTIAWTLHVKNVSPESIEMLRKKSSIEVKFTSIGAGHFPINHAFYFGIPSEPGAIEDARAEAWDNNVIIQIDFDKLQDFDTYHAGLSTSDFKEFPCPHSESHGKVSKEGTPKVSKNSDVDVAVENTAIDELNIEITGKFSKTAVNSHASKPKKQKKTAIKKNRSFSESHCDELQADIEEEEATKHKKLINTIQNSNNCVIHKTRSISESSNDEQHTCEPILKGILKRRSSYNRSVSECSVDDNPSGVYSCSMDLGIGSFSSIPEERGQEMSESVRKTVTFDKNLCRKLLFKMNSTIVGQRKPKTNKRKKKKRTTADRERRYSEGEASDYESKQSEEGPPKSKTCDCEQGNGTSEGMGRPRVNSKACRVIDKQAKGPDTDKTAHLEFKNGLMFDIEI